MTCRCFKMDVMQEVYNLPSGEKSAASWFQISYRNKTMRLGPSLQARMVLYD